MAIYSGFSHKKWWFSIVMWTFTRGYLNSYPPKKTKKRQSQCHEHDAEIPQCHNRKRRNLPAKNLTKTTIHVSWFVLTSRRVMKDDSTWFNYVKECKGMERNVKESNMIADSKWFKCFPPKHLQSVLLQLITSHWQWWLRASNGNRRFLAPSTSIFHLIGSRSSDGIKSLYLRMLKSEAPPANQSAMLPT